jgi:hypothetical protein
MKEGNGTIWSATVGLQSAHWRNHMFLNGRVSAVSAQPNLLNDVSQ